MDGGLQGSPARGAGLRQLDSAFPTGSIRATLAADSCGVPEGIDAGQELQFAYHTSASGLTGLVSGVSGFDGGTPFGQAEYTYDDHGRLTAVVISVPDEDEPDGFIEYYHSYRYAEAAFLPPAYVFDRYRYLITRFTTSSAPCLSPACNLPDDLLVENRYDDKKRVVEQAVPGGAQVSYAYGTNPASGNSTVTVTTLDDRRDLDGNLLPPIAEYYEFNAGRQLVRYTNGKGDTTLLWTDAASGVTRQCFYPGAVEAQAGALPANCVLGGGSPGPAMSFTQTETFSGTGSPWTYDTVSTFSDGSTGKTYTNHYHAVYTEDSSSGFVSASDDDAEFRQNFSLDANLDFRQTVNASPLGTSFNHDSNHQLDSYGRLGSYTSNNGCGSSDNFSYYPVSGPQTGQIHDDGLHTFDYSGPDRPSRITDLEGRSTLLSWNREGAPRLIQANFPGGDTVSYKYMKERNFTTNAVREIRINGNAYKFDIPARMPKSPTWITPERQVNNADVIPWLVHDGEWHEDIALGFGRTGGSYYDHTGQVKLNGKPIADLQYDQDGRLIRTCRYAGGSTCIETKHQYDENGLLVATRTGSLPKVTFEYGPLNRLKKSTMHTSPPEVTHFVQDLFGDIVQVQEEDFGGGVAAQAGFDYSSGRDGTGLTDPNGGTTSWDFNSMRAQVRETAPDEGGGDRVTIFNLDNRNRVNSLEDPGGFDMGVTYGANQCLDPSYLEEMACDGPNGSRIYSVARNAIGWPLTIAQSDGASRSQDIEYDEGGRVTAVEWGSYLDRLLELTYDPSTRKLTDLHVKESSSGISRFRWEYGFETASTSWHRPLTATLYIADPVSGTEMAAAQLTLAYSAATGLLETVGIGGESAGAGVWRTSSYDANWLLSGMDWEWDDTFPGAPGGAMRLGVSLGRRPDGMINSIGLDGSGIFPDDSISYSFDRSRRLTGSTSSRRGNAVNTYDPNGNRLNSPWGGAVVNAPTSRLKSWPSVAGAIDYQYDGNGSLIGQVGPNALDERTLSWGPCGRNLENVEIESATGTRLAEYDYDSGGRRIGKRVCDNWDGSACLVVWEETRYLWAGERLIAEMDSNKITRRIYTWLGIAPTVVTDIAYSVEGEPIPTSYAIASDHRSLPHQAIRLSDGVVVWQAEYDDWGRAVSVEDDPDGDAIQFTLNWRLAGQYWDAETGYHYNNQRYYDPETGRYVSSDPIGYNGGSLNLYGYVGGNPVNGVDFTGTVVDTAFDIGAVAYDLSVLASQGGGENNENWASLMMDMAALAIPGMPAVGGITVRGAKAAAKECADQSLKYSKKISKQMQERGWTDDMIREAMQTEGIPAQGKINPATRYKHPTTGQSVVIDNVTGEIFAVGGPNFKYL